MGTEIVPRVACNCEACIGFLVLTSVLLWAEPFPQRSWKICSTILNWKFWSNDSMVVSFRSVAAETACKNHESNARTAVGRAYYRLELVQSASFGWRRENNAVWRCYYNHEVIRSKDKFEWRTLCQWFKPLLALGMCIINAICRSSTIKPSAAWSLGVSYRRRRQLSPLLVQWRLIVSKVD